jgi:hypothetical protein
LAVLIRQINWCWVYRERESAMGKKSIPVPLGQQYGFSVITWFLMIPVFLIALLILTILFYEGRKAYWDVQVKEMCVRDGGVKIFEKLRISKADIDLLGRVDGKIDVPIKQLAKPESPAYMELEFTNLREGEPRITRTESAVIRRADRIVVARWVIYSRFGGDFPSPAHPSISRCPELKKITSDLQPLFIVEGDSK